MARAQGTIGKLVERIAFEDPTPAAFVVTSLTRVGTVATATTALPHGFLLRDYVVLAGATPAGYTGKVKITPSGPTAFTYDVADTLETPATGAITATYASDPQGGRRVTWHTVVENIPAEAIPISATERLAMASAFATVRRVLFRIQTRHDVKETMRVRWVPTWPPAADARVFQIIGILGEHDGRSYMFLECTA